MPISAEHNRTNAPRLGQKRQKPGENETGNSNNSPLRHVSIRQPTSHIEQKIESNGDTEAGANATDMVKATRSCDAGLPGSRGEPGHGVGEHQNFLCAGMTSSSDRRTRSFV